MKKYVIKLSGVIMGLLSLLACTDNETMYTITMPNDGQIVLNASSTVLVLDKTNASTHTAISLHWDSLTYGISTPVTYTIQMDTLNGTFASPVEDEIPVNTYQTSYTDSVFNKKMLNLLKLKEKVESTIKVRLKANLANGSYPVYSNMVNVKVTPYELPKKVSLLYMPGLSSWSDFSTKVCSRMNDGKYEGFVQATQWANFKFTSQPDLNGAVYGSVPNSLYSLDASSNMWNIWFDEGGYFLVKADLNAMTWSKTAITSICVTGDFNGWSLTANQMVYDNTKKLWTSTCDINSIGWGIQIIINGDWGFKYGDTEKDGSLVLGGSNIIPSSTGSKVITVDLSNPEKYTYKIQ